MEKQKYIQRLSAKKKSINQLLIGIILIVVVNLLGSSHFYRFDMTAENRYSLTSATKDLIKDLDDIVYFKVYLDGNFPSEFRRLRNETREMLDEFSAYSDNIQYDFINPSEGDDREKIEAKYRSLWEKGLRPTQLDVREVDGASQRVIFPGAIVSYRGREVPMHILHQKINVPDQEMINSSVQALEYNLASTIRKLTVEDKPKIAFLDRHDELSPRYVSDITNELSDFYEVDIINLDRDYDRLNEVKTIIVADPVEPFTDEEKFLLDQYIMHGGSALWLVNPVFADMDSLNYAPETIGMPSDINIDDMLFRYGARLNLNLIQDLNAAKIPITTGYIGNRPQISMLPWVFYPMVSNASDHPIVKNINAVRTEFVSSIDIIDVDGVEKSELLETSKYSRVLRTPVNISLDIMQNPLPEELYNEKPQTVSVLLEGEFESVYRNRPHPNVNLPGNITFRENSKPTAQIIVSDGSIIHNQLDRRGEPIPLGYDRYTGQLYGNSDFILNSVNYLADDTGIMEARAKEVSLRMLDKRRIEENKLAVQVFNVIIPLALIIIFGIIKRFFRSMKYSRTK